MTVRRGEGPPDPEVLARVRAALSARRGRERLDVLLDEKDPRALVRGLPPDELYLTIREIGLSDASELVRLASPEQFRTFLDLACWTGGHLEARRALSWLRAARAGSLDSPRAAARWKAKLGKLDPELLAIVLRDTLRVHDLTEAPDAQPSGDRFVRTPDGRFLVEFAVEGADYAAVRGLVDDLVSDDPFAAARLLSSIRWELPSELEESELRWRTGRLADLGYPNREEALSWFARPTAKPAAHAGPPARPPGFLPRVGSGSFLGRAAARLPADALQGLELELVVAANAVLVADDVDPGDLPGVRDAVEVARVFVEMGLEELSGADEARAAEVLATSPVKPLFQRGFGLVLQLRWRAERLFREGGAGTPQLPLLDPPLGEAMAALVRRRPLYFPGLDLPRERWGSIAAGAFEPRRFLGSTEVSRSSDALGRAEELTRLAARLGLVAPEPRSPHVRLSTLYLTALANERLGRAFVAAPLAVADVPAAARALERIEDPRLLAEGDAGALLAALATSRAEELAPLRDVEGGAPPASALLVEP